QRQVCCPKPPQPPASAMSTFAHASSRFPAPEQKGTGNEARPKKLPVAKSTRVQCAPPAPTACARRESPLPQSDAASHPKGSGCSLQSGFGGRAMQCGLCRGTRSREASLLRESGLSVEDN